LQNRYAGITELAETIYTRATRARSETGSATLPDMSFTREQLALLGGAEEVDIETQPPDGPAHRATIWIVVDNDSAYVRSVNGARGRWYRDLQANPAGAVHVDGRRLPVTAIPAADSDSVERVSAALGKKYGRGASVDSMLKPDTLETTLRLEPA
jgi:hypothetical protein